MQSAYDIARTRLREGQIRVRRIPQLALKQFKELMKQNSGKLKFAGYDE
jgi:hypothetical protein